MIAPLTKIHDGPLVPDGVDAEYFVDAKGQYMRRRVDGTEEFWAGRRWVRG